MIPLALRLTRAWQLNAFAQNASLCANQKRRCGDISALLRVSNSPQALQNEFTIGFSRSLLKNKDLNQGLDLLPGAKFAQVCL
jgi:hypothetical protein